MLKSDSSFWFVFFQAWTPLDPVASLAGTSVLGDQVSVEIASGQLEMGPRNYDSQIDTNPPLFQA